MGKRKTRIMAGICASIVMFAFSGCNNAKEEKGSWTPSSSVNMIVPYAAGGGTDLLARAIAEHIDLDGQTMYITNIEGAGSVVGTMEAYHARNDGLTLLSQAPETCAFGYFDGAMEPNLCDEMIWIAGLVNDFGTLAVVADSPYETLEDVLTAAKENPDTLTLASLGTGSSKASVQDFLRQTGAAITYVPYDSAAKSRSAAMGGHEDLLWVNWSEIKAYVDSGDFRILALAAEERQEIAPDILTFNELGYNISHAVTRSVLLPPETDEEIAHYYEAKLKEVFENEEFRTTMRETLGYNMVFTDMDSMKDKIAETMAWAEKSLGNG